MDLAPEGGLQRFKVQGFGRCGSHQGPDFSLDFLRQRFLEPLFWPVRAGEASNLAWQICSLTSTNSFTKLRKRRYSSICS